MPQTIVSTEKLRLDLDIDTASARRASGTRLMVWHRGHTICRSSLMTCVRDTNDIKNATGYSGDQRAHRQRAWDGAVEPALFRASHGVLRLIHIQACLPQASA